MGDRTTMYTDRVDWYMQGRPSYPADLVRLPDGSRIDRSGVVADIGSGTGKLAELLLDNGNAVYAVEPNAAMRAAAEQVLGGRPGFVSVDGTAERTGLPDATVDLITVGQALHWFDLPRARAEFTRILRPGGTVLLAWNEKPATLPPLRRDLDAVLREAVPGYAAAADADTDVNTLAADFFGAGRWTSRILPHSQVLTLPAFLARVLSASYAPAAGEPAWHELTDRLRDLHHRHGTDGTVRLDYDTWVAHGHF